MAYEITRGAVARPQKVVVYGPEGIGKTTLAAAFPRPLFIDTEAGTDHLDVARLPAPTSWQMLLEEAAYIRDYPAECGGTLVIDTADWAERLCAEHVCRAGGYKSIEEPGYGKGYVMVRDEFGKILNILTEVSERGLNVVVTAHAVITKFEQPDEMGAYDRWGMKLIDGKRASVAALLKEWADAVLFANYKTVVVTVDRDGRKSKAQGGKNRVLHTTHAATWDAKNRWGLADEVPMEWAQLAPYIPVPALGQGAPRLSAAQIEEARAIPDPFAPEGDVLDRARAAQGEMDAMMGRAPGPAAALPDHMRPVADLMAADGVSAAQLQAAMAARGHLTPDTPLAAWSPDFAGWCVSVWPDIRGYISANLADVR